ncbi:MAG: ATP-binding protein [Ketobacter sp.]|nr:MAG: hybrid sensor histidine kinase/response regulator [Ketobacter sp.]
MTLDVDKLAFEHCEDEPIHIPESIQSYGYLFAINQENHRIEIISENVIDLFNLQGDIVGTDFFALLDEDQEGVDFILETYQRARNRKTRLPIKIKFKETLIRQLSDRDFFAVIYNSADRLIIELEPAAKFRKAYTAEHYIKIYAMSIAPKFKAFDSLNEMAQEIVETIKYITDMERVVLYKFNDDDSGKVIAEAKNNEVDAYLNLYYPASDIPPQARELYKKNWVRLTPNVDLAPSRLIPTTQDSGREPLDLTQSLLRTLSPIHCQYIRNQGLRASFSMSLVTHDRLWGLISCHSRNPTYIPQDVRLQCENLSQLFSWHLYAKEEELFFKQKELADRSIEAMLDKISPSFPIVSVFSQHEEEVLRLMDADGFIFYSDQEVISLGQTPDLNIVQDMYNRVDTHDRKPFITNSIDKKWGTSEQLNGIYGVMLIPLLEKRSYFTAWFRKERVYIQKWAGSPDEKNVDASKRERLMPRTSFQVHIKEVAGASKEFDQNDVDMASRFNRMFLAHALEVQEKMRKNMNDLEQQDRHKNEFLATLAHELRNPLSPISTGVSLLEISDKSDVREKVLATIKRQVGYMTKLIDDLMDVSRITQGKIKLDIQHIVVQEVLSNAVEIIESLMREKGHQLVLDMPEPPVYIHGDSARLSQVFSNIINNAIKYTDRNGKIEVSLQLNERHISVKIKDNGLGIPKEKLKDIFSMFTQVEAHSTHTKGGLGIGLTLVDRLVKLHHGEVIARSDGERQGSEFEVILPRANESSQQQTSTASTEDADRKQRVLVVDDNPDVTELLNILLQNAGHKTATASNGREAIDLFKQFKPDFALLDIGMPDIDGYELCKILRKLPEAKNTIFLSQSGWGNKEYVDRALEVGFTRHFVKPLDFSVLQAALNKYAK